MLTKVQIIMNNSVNPILLRPVLGILLAINSVRLKMEQFMSWLQSDQDAVSFFLLVAVRVSITQLKAIHKTLKDSGTLLF